jgi:toxin ParE1/3/4
MRKVFWSFDAKTGLAEIVGYIKETSGVKVARQIYNRLQQKIEKSTTYPESSRIVPELAEIGVVEYQEIIESPWRVFFRTADDEVRIVSIIDGRRNVEEVLYRKMIEGKLK